MQSIFRKSGNVTFKEARSSAWLVATCHLDSRALDRWTAGHWQSDKFFWIVSQFLCSERSSLCLCVDYFIFRNSRADFSYLYRWWLYLTHFIYRIYYIFTFPPTVSCNIFTSKRNIPEFSVQMLSSQTRNIRKIIIILNMSILQLWCFIINHWTVQSFHCTLICLY